MGAVCAFIGYLQYYLFMTLFGFLMYITTGCEMLGLHDTSFLLDDDVNQHTIVAVGIFEKFDYVTMKNYLIGKTDVIDKCQSKLVKKFGLYWY